MEIAKLEIEAVEKVVGAANVEILDLNELQLALVGGGTGDIHLG